MNAKRTKVSLVIPTIRDLNFLKAWGSEFKNCDLIVVEDHEEIEVHIPSTKFLTIEHYTRNDIDKEFGEESWIFSRKNAGIRSYGFWKAYKKGADVIVTLDDDCYPVNSGFISQHLENLTSRHLAGWIYTYPDPKWNFTRGIPYSVRDKIRSVISHGLWSGAIDLDGVVEMKLTRLLNEKPYPPIRQVIPKGSYYPMCSMNLAFTREITPLMFFPMMGYRKDGTQWPYDRFEDIWAGILSKKIIDHLGLGVINGSPFVNHKKRSKPKENYAKEIEGMRVNEDLWKKVDAINLLSRTPKSCYIELACKVDFPKTRYFDKLKDAMIIWANMF